MRPLKMSIKTDAITPYYLCGKISFHAFPASYYKPGKEFEKMDVGVCYELEHVEEIEMKCWTQSELIEKLENNSIEDIFISLKVSGLISASELEELNNNKQGLINYLKSPWKSDAPDITD